MKKVLYFLARHRVGDDVQGEFDLVIVGHYDSFKIAMQIKKKMERDMGISYLIAKGGIDSIIIE